MVASWRKSWDNSKRRHECSLPIIPNPQPASWKQQLRVRRGWVSGHGSPCPWETRTDESVWAPRGDPRDGAVKMLSSTFVSGTFYTPTLSCPSHCLPLTTGCTTLRPPSLPPLFSHRWLPQMTSDIPAAVGRPEFWTAAVFWTAVLDMAGLQRGLSVPEPPGRLMSHSSGCNPWVPSSVQEISHITCAWAGTLTGLLHTGRALGSYLPAQGLGDQDRGLLST